ncbi:protein-L-isoaspartate O-methyltransferase family protein, partial [Longimycelium tulufanense]|uniref:protein-L-isoaspartate O-methyltransferase family protein n=1 Tax=Longimycelium tulufanense TaxID=907463 RepID=UPI001E63C750
RAFAAVPRHRCLRRFRYRADEHTLAPDTMPDEAVLDIVYANNSLITHTGRDGDPPSSSSAPSLMAKMLETLDLAPGHRVLEIGAGTGYNAALITHITGAPVTTIEAGAAAAAGATDSIRALDLVDRVQVIHGDGYDGHPPNGPYDRIIATCGIAGIPPHWLDQLTDDGLILAPLAFAGVHPILTARRNDSGELTARIAMWGDFMPAAGHLRPAELFHHDPAHDIPAARLRPAEGTDTELTTEQYHDLWCYLGIRDPRTSRAYLAGDQLDPSRGACALVDPTDGAAWIHHDGGITLAGADHLHDHLATLTADWHHAGRPPATAWTVTLRHADTGAAGLLLPHHWTLTYG